MKQTPLIFSIIALVAVAALGIIQLTSNDNGKKKATSGEAPEMGGCPIKLVLNKEKTDTIVMVNVSKKTAAEPAEKFI